ncbi:MAG: response regulator, partial [Myxococcales bacterium]|nr:response regulator [Myxococcales bacterium]
ADVLGYPSPTDFVGRQMLDFIHPDDREETLVRVRRMAETGQPLPPRELRTLRADGAVVVLELAPVRSVSLVDGPASLVLGRDRTPQRKLQERLLSADRLTSLGNLAAGVAHEISSPLTYVMGNLSVLSEALERMQATTDRPGEITDLLKALADARVGAERVRDLLADLKVFARPDVGARQALELRKVMDTAINMAWPEIRGLARLVRDYGPTPAVRGVESKLALAFFHLLVNAAQAIDAGAIDDNALEVGLGTDLEGWAEVEIRDSGRGLTEVVQARMWEPFFTTRPRGEGAGLGLPVVRSVVASMGGEVEGSPRARGGAVFRVRLPPDAAPLERSPQPEPRLQEAEPEVRSGRILVVDDEPVMGALMRRALAGHEVYILTSARDALELLEALEFDVLICDLVMPGQGGREIYEELSQRRPELAERIVFVTAGAVHAAEREFLERIRNIIVDKPFEFSELRAAVQAILRRS